MKLKDLITEANYTEDWLEFKIGDIVTPIKKYFRDDSKEFYDAEIIDMKNGHKIIYLKTKSGQKYGNGFKAFKFKLSKKK